MNSINQVVSFSLDEETFGVDILTVRDIIRYMTITRVPGAPPGVLGVINLRGQIIPVVDLRARLGLEARAAAGATRIIVLEMAGGVTGFVVDSVQKVINLESAVIEPAPELTVQIDSSIVTGIARLESQILILLDFDRVLREEDVPLAA